MEEPSQGTRNVKGKEQCEKRSQMFKGNVLHKLTRLFFSLFTLKFKQIFRRLEKIVKS